MKFLAWFEIGDAADARWQWLQRCWAIFALLLFGATWRLWIPQEVFPQVPFVRAAGSLPAACQWVALSGVIVSLVIALCVSKQLNDWGRASLFLAFAGLLVLLILTDQHRLQPWAYQLVLLAVVFATVPGSRSHRARGLALLRILTLGIYLYSALGKFDFQFLHTVGQQLLATTCGFVGLEIGGWPLPFRLLLAGTFPLAELLIVVTLAVPRLRRAGVVSAVILHVSLLVVLGPLGLQHQPGVLVWNVFFIAQVLLLFAGVSPRAIDADDRSPADARVSHPWTPACVVLAAVVLPLLEPIGWFDHWPAWGLYSPRNSRAIVEIHPVAIKNLPTGLQAYLAHADAEESWIRLNIDEWSLATLSVPIYPQDRFQLGVAESIAARYGLERTIRVRLLGMSNRLTGQRQETTLTGRQQILQAGQRFRLNARPTDRR